MNLHDEFRSDRVAKLGQTGALHHAGTTSVTQNTDKYLSRDA